jgi:branched-chain amino acid transport system permease protein
MARLRAGRWLLGGLAALGGTFLARDAYTISVIEMIAIAALTASSLRFVMLIGELNFATAAFVGIGAYATGLATTLLRWPFAAALLAGGVLAAAVSVVFGAITLRTRGPYFLLVGFAFTEAARIVYSKIDLLGGTSGMIGIFPPRTLDRWMPLLVTGIALALIFALWVVERSDLGKVLVAIRDNEDVARSVGINALFARVACVAAASAAAGVAGSLHAFVNNVISPGDFGFLLSTFALAYVKVGGEASVVGPIVGSALLVVLGSYALGLGAGEHLFYGAAILGAVMLMPKGITGLAGKAAGGLSLRWRARPREPAPARPPRTPSPQARPPEERA